MTTNPEQRRVPLDGGFVMQLRDSELESVDAGLGEFGSLRLAEAVRALPATDRAPLWELAVRHYGRRKPLEQAAAEIGIDAQRARGLVEALSKALAA
jgi:hypothetical protein